MRALARASSVLERASSDLSLAHYRILSAIAAGDERASRIATKLAVGRPAVSAAVDSLRQRGLLSSSDVAGDQRASALRLTADGEALLRQVEEQLLARIDQLCASVPDGDALIDALTRLGPAIDAYRATHHAAAGAHGAGGVGTGGGSL